MLLKEIANISTGIFASPIADGDVVYLQIKHFNENGFLADHVTPDLPINNQTEKHLLSEGDILFIAKGTKNTAILFNENYGQCVASSTFLVVKLMDGYKNVITPEYLCWFINLQKTQEYIKTKARGSSMPSVSKVELQDLEILIPSLEKQRLIVKINALQKQEEILNEQIKQLKSKYISKKLISIISE